MEGRRYGGMNSRREVIATGISNIALFVHSSADAEEVEVRDRVYKMPVRVI